MANYTLEFYDAGSTRHESICVIESAVPFLPIQKGDLINPRAWEKHYAEQAPAGALLKVVGIEHFIVWRPEIGHFEHKLGIFSLAVRDTDEARRFK
jgi:hypothetical protein